jgi:hypothetical protein
VCFCCQHTNSMLTARGCTCVPVAVYSARRTLSHLSQHTPALLPCVAPFHHQPPPSILTSLFTPFNPPPSLPCASPQCRRAVQLRSQAARELCLRRPAVCAACAAVSHTSHNTPLPPSHTTLSHTTQNCADELFSYAAKLLESFAYVGLGDDLNSSAELAAAALGRALDGPAYAHGELFIPGVKKVGACKCKGSQGLIGVCAGISGLGVYGGCFLPGVKKVHACRGRRVVALGSGVQ